jgi:hypothetical protein
MAVGLDLQYEMQEPHALNGLVESLGGLHGNLAADTGNLSKLRGASGLRALRLCLG